MTIDKEKQMNEDKAKDLLAIADGLIKSIKNYDKDFNLARDEYHNCVLTGYRDSAFGILFSLFTLNYIPSGEFHRKLHEMNKAIYKKIA